MFKPEEINVIPLIEDIPYILNPEDIVMGYEGKREHMRVFLAKSDLAMNYGLISSVFALKYSLFKLREVEEKDGTKIYPIIGFGSCPFRGGLNPETSQTIIGEWRAVQTFTIQSAFKYDYSAKDVEKSIDLINRGKKKRAVEIDEEKVMELIYKSSEEYRKQVHKLVDVVNRIATFAPKRRERKLHIGLFGYSRSFDGTSLPRAISYCCALYSIGVPPELFGLDIGRMWEFVLENSMVDEQVSEAMKYSNPKVLEKFGININEIAGNIGIEIEIHEEHMRITNEIWEVLRKNQLTMLQDKIVEAASIRRFLG